jgi:hypothetical protein
MDYAFSLVLTGPDMEVTIRIEHPFTVVHQNRGLVRLEPGRDWEKLGPVLGMFGLTATSGTAQADGRLELQFHDGTRLEVSPSTVRTSAVEE